MRKPLAIIFMSLAIISCQIENQKKEELKTDDNTVFLSLDNVSTGITFQNNIIPVKNLNIIDFVYFYNGGGVATADFNNDGLEDLFFVSNQKDNELYINKGNLKFENITAKAGVQGKSEWNTGVTVADVNGDGFMDIYVLGVAHFNGLKSKNELFINNGDLTFTEQSKEFGLDIQSYATHASFFDYDHDGDLDCYLLNYALEESENYVPIDKGRKNDEFSGDCLLKNEGGKFIDVTLSSGIMKSKIGFGLSVSVADINNDGWEDIYVANDFHEDDYLYINQKNGKFLEQGRLYFNHFSRFSMGSDIADINNDGFYDIMNLDMYPEKYEIEKASVGEDPFDIYSYKLSYGYFPQYAKNSLQLNNAGKSFSEIACFAGVSATDWSWATLFADFDNDGIKDLFVSNGIPKRPNDLDFISFVLNYQKRDPSAINLDKYYDEAIGKMPSGSYHDFIFKGTKSLQFIDKSFEWGFDKETVSNGTVYSDLDNDGDLDLVINRLNEPIGFYENKSNELFKNNFVQFELKTESNNKYAIGSKVEVFTNGNKQSQQLINSRGFQSAVGNNLNFGLGNTKKVDSVKIYWNTGETQLLKDVAINRKNTIIKNGSIDLIPHLNKKSFIKEIESPIPFVHKENDFNDFIREPLMPFKVSTEGPALAIGDVNNDGFDDVFIGGARSQEGELWLQQMNGKFKKSIQKSFQIDKELEQVDAVFFDANNDGYKDLYVTIAGNEFYGEMDNQFDCLYMNDGKGNFIKSIDRLPKMPVNTSCVKVMDYDKDGDIDIFVGGRVVSKNYGLNPRSYVLENDGKGFFKDVTLKVFPELKDCGMITDADWADIDNDGDVDLLVVGEWMEPIIFKNNKTSFKKEKISDYHYFGLWHGLSIADFDGDGDLDFIAGNIGLNSKFYKSRNENLRMYVKDFDNNGTIEQFVTYFENGKWYPIDGRDDLGKTMPSIIKKRFLTHKDFATKSIHEIFTKEELKNCKTLKVNTFQTLLFKNQGNGKFQAHALPKEVNYSTMFSIFPIVNSDKKVERILLGGNLHSVNTWQTPYDASFGVTLTSKKQGISFDGNSNFYVKGEIRKIKDITIGNAKNIVVAKNNGPIQFFTVVNE